MSELIRQTDPADPQAIVAMRAYFDELNKIFPHGFDPGPLTSETLGDMRTPLGAFLLAFQKGLVIGCVGLRQMGTGTGEVKRLWVSPVARGQGLAARLMERIEREALNLGMTRLVLDTSRHLPGAVAFYRKHGWSEINRYNDNPYAHHFFEKRI